MLSNIQIVYLENYPKLIPILADWAYQEWSKYDPDFTMEKAINSFNSRLNHNKIPLTLVAVEGENPIGMISLKPTISPKGYEDKQPWIGSLYVIPSKRGIGVGKKLMAAIKDVALNLGYNELFLYTSVPLARDWYTANGWKIITTDIYKNHTITIMNYMIA